MPAKLGTFEGVFVSTTLNVLSILMFLRFGYISSQIGFLGILGLLLICYIINLLTTMSLSAIASNGTVRSGGAYYLISRSLGPEFGGSIGIVFYLGMMFNTGINAVAFIDSLPFTRQSTHSELSGFFWSRYLAATAVSLVCTSICLAGSSMFARSSNSLLLILIISISSIPLSPVFLPAFSSQNPPVTYTGFSWQTFRQNLVPRSPLLNHESWQNLFGIFFPATGGIFAGACMSGDLRNPSSAIPRGTLYGLLVTFLLYFVVILSLNSTVTRDSMYIDLNIISDVNVSAILISCGELATSAFSVLMGIIGSAKLLQALARDNLLPGLGIFSRGTAKSDEPINAIIISFICLQVIMLADIDRIASLTTMAYLMTFTVTNLSCFLLKIQAAPNFRPSFKYFTWQTAAIGTISCVAAMFYVDSVHATACLTIMTTLFMIIHYASDPKPWGDVTQSLIYHQVRKYLLRLKHEHVKFWRPQILLLINDPRHQYKLVQFCNSLKKGGLYILGHIIVSEDFPATVWEIKRQQLTLTRYIDFSRIKAFVNIAISPRIEWGARNIVLNAGLGEMRPNIVVMGFLNLRDARYADPTCDTSTDSPILDSPILESSSTHSYIHTDHLSLPTDSNRLESAMSPSSYVTILEDLLLHLQINVAIAKGFQSLQHPSWPPPSIWQQLSHLLRFRHHSHTLEQDSSKSPVKWIDLWPIQMSAEFACESSGEPRNILTTNFDTYAFVLQLGCILHTVKSWHKTLRLRVSVFVEHAKDIPDEKSRVEKLLKILRVDAVVRVFNLNSGYLPTYEYIVKGHRNVNPCVVKHVETVLHSDSWWQSLSRYRANDNTSSTVSSIPVPLGSPRPDGELGIISHRLPAQFLHNDSLSMLFRNSSRDFTEPNHQFHHWGFQDDTDIDSTPASILLTQRSRARRSTSLAAVFPRHLESIEVPNDVNTSVPFSMMSQLLDTRNGSHSTSQSLTTCLSDDTSKLLSSPRNENFHPKISRARTFPVNIDASTSHKSEYASQKLVKLRTISSPNKSSLHDHLDASVSKLDIHPTFSCRRVPETLINAQEGYDEPSVQFADTISDDDTSPVTNFPSPLPSPLSHHPPQLATEALPIPNHSSQPHRTHAHTSPLNNGDAGLFTADTTRVKRHLTFNELPSRVQHVIINELFRLKSGRGTSSSYSGVNFECTDVKNPDDDPCENNSTAVIFTTLPSPRPGTGRSAKDSLRYLRDLDILCAGCAPILLVHSNTLTVTVNL